MGKRTQKKHTPVRHKKPQSSTFVYIHYISLALVAVAVVLAGKGLLSATSKIHVLGVQTGPVLLAKGGDDSGGDNHGGGGGSSGGGSNSGGNNSGGGSPSGGSISGVSNNGGPSNSGGGDNHGGNNANGGSVGSQQAVPDATQVDCVGPDGTHFTTSFKNCSDLNNAWHHSNFSFTSLSAPQSPVNLENGVKPNIQPTSTENETPKPQVPPQNPNQGNPQKFEVKTEDGRRRIDLEQNGVEVRIEKEGETIKAKAEKPDGTETELEAKDTLETINKELETEGIEVATTAAQTLTIKKGEVKAETELPVGVDPTTHELTVTTPAGTKTVTVLPDAAVKSLLDNKLLTNVQSQVSSQSGITQNVILTTVNNEPTFAVNGILQKRILGVVPVGFAKKTFVSATTGQVVKTDETLLNRILETLSF